jgi:hypothetical protein
MTELEELKFINKTANRISKELYKEIDELNVNNKRRFYIYESIIMTLVIALCKYFEDEGKMDTYLDHFVKNVEFNLRDLN